MSGGNYIFKITVSFFFFLSASVIYAQETDLTASRYRYQNAKVKAMVLDSKYLQPLSNVTVYLMPFGDSTITNVSLSGSNGMVVFDNVVSGRYELKAELLGYYTYSKVYEIAGVSGWDVDLGTISMEESPEEIDAATITAAGNPITIQNDTIVYHASSFRVGENAMLEDLLKKMPGISIGEDGTATVNGENVDRITVGGRTFFFGDLSMALKNLPAKIVERISVSRQGSKSSQRDGISTEIDKETVMDVGLKEEYQEGWFGDARLGAGATLNGRNDNPLTQDKKILYNGSAMASVFGKENQAVFIGNAYNIQTSDGGSLNIPDLPEDDYADLGGLMTAIKAGANYNTSRIRNFETTVSTNYRHSTKDDKRRYSRTSFVSGVGDIITEGGADASGKEDQLMVDMEIYKEHGKLLVDFTPRFYFRKSGTNSNNFSNTSNGFIVSDSKQLFTSGTLGLTGTSFGKQGRRAGLEVNYSAGTSYGNRLEQSLQTINYEIFGKKLDLAGRIFYYEPLEERWGIETSFSSVINSNLEDRRAFNGDGSGNDRFSNSADRRFLQEGASILMQWSNDTSTVKFGVTAYGYNDVMDAMFRGRNTVSGKGDWRFHWSPIAIYSWSKDGHDLSFEYTSLAEPATSRRMIPVPDISNPIQVTIGNIYLKSGVTNNLTAYYNMVNYTTFTFLTVYATAGIENHGTVYASWFDNDRTRYAVPVNAKKPGTNANVFAVLNQPFGKEKNLTLSFSVQANVENQYSYQAKSIQPRFDLESFDYDSFMDGFWGNSSGDRFYSGQSGFAESGTTSSDWGLGLGLKYNKGIFTGNITTSVMNSRAYYSLNNVANLNVWDYNVGGDVVFQPGKGWGLGTDAHYVLFHGYAPGFGRPEFRWNMSLSKTIKALTLGMKARDILNQERSLARTVSSDYLEDSYRNVMGRTILFSVSFNFGKLNPSKTSAVSDSLDRLEY